MDALDRIVVPLDGSAPARRALRPARLLAESLGVPVELMAVRFGGRRDDVEQELRDAAAAAGVLQPELDVVCNDLGSPAVLIEDRLPPNSMLCMTTHARRGMGEAILGSVAQELVRRVHRPSVLVGPAVDDSRLVPVDDVVVCVDGSEESHAIVATVLPFVRRLGAKLRIVEVVHPDPTVHARQVADGEVLDEAAFDRLIHSITGIALRGEMLTSAEPARAIAEHTSSGSLLAMVTHARRGLARVVLGSTTGAVVRHATVPVLVFRPRGLPEA